MSTSNRRRWYELSLLALACWAATAAQDAHAVSTTNCNAAATTIALIAECAAT